MALKSFVYISEVDNLSDARYAAGMAVDLLGFKLDPNDITSLDLEKFKEISEWVSGVKIVGEFGELAPEETKQLLEAYDVNYLLISDEAKIHEFSMLDIPLILKVNAENFEHVASTMNYCNDLVDFFLLDADAGTLEPSTEKQLKELAKLYPTILGYGIDPTNASTIATELGIKGIALKGSPELRPGYKDFDEMAEILEALEVD